MLRGIGPPFYGRRMSTSPDARLANLLGALAAGLADQIQTATAQEAHMTGVAPDALIAMLDFTPSGTVDALSQTVGLTHSGGVRLVDRLVDNGLVERGPGRDARSITIRLTRRGIAIAKRVRLRRSEEIDAVLDGLSTRQRSELVRACEAVIANLTHQRLARRAAGDSPAGGALCRMCDFEACGRQLDQCPAAREAGRGLRGGMAR
jgi:MarR family transcriptional repressor of emrRAB